MERTIAALQAPAATITSSTASHLAIMNFAINVPSEPQVKFYLLMLHLMGDLDGN